MRHVLAFAIGSLSMAGLLAQERVAAAAKPADPPPPRIERERNAAAEAARARARKGDCAGALEGFDQAISHSIDPTLRRDRGLCHERLGNPYPAIDDFRAYLAASPDAPDADDVRARLEHLEEQVGVGGPPPRDDSAQLGVRASASMSVAGDGKNGIYDSAKLEEGDAETPLRRGHGFQLTPFLGVRRWFFGNSVSSSPWSETVGVRLNFWMNPTGSFFGEIGYERFNATQEDVATVAGLSSQLGYEARLPIKRESIDNLWVMGLGLGYESLWLSQTGSGSLATGDASFGAVLGRGRFGLRHNFTGRTGIEATLDGAAGRFFAIGSSVNGVTGGMLGLNVGLAFGL